MTFATLSRRVELGTVSSDISVVVRAPVTGVVLVIAVAIGDAVGIGDELVVVESMKMEIPIESPTAGRVAGIDVVVGWAVSEGDVLVTIQ